jgi:glycine betaine/proline transport system substrate-binding protein
MSNMEKKMKRIFKITSLATATFALAAGAAVAAGPGDGKSVQPMGTGRPDHQIIYDVIETGLTDLGYEVKELLTGSYPVIHLSVGQGDADFTAVHWSNLHREYYENSGGDDTLSRIGPLFTNAMQGYFIDKATADAYGISKLDQMKDPAIAALFDSDGDGKANLTGCNPGWGCEKVIEHQLDAFELRDHINHDKGSYFALMANTIERKKAGQPIFYTAWSPSWMMATLRPGEDVIFLEAPFSSLPGVENANTVMADGRNPGFASNDIYIVINNEFAAENPAAAKFLSLLRIPIADLNVGMEGLYSGDDSPAAIRKIADEWIAANQTAFDGWVAEAAKEAG